ncbi:unnamed protein product [Vitrella brassicaformis CCMP3155]|uniref:Uncharacterized protein n=2 Tax=Vitrella brassicaformis TaxID=1169539 RepID=A0A0G4ETN3_VITBC|nr:unnamed protein product [Vitrella brassicaformis CCMP3155]|eukprot:CEM01976.1 unnamed protein product [Vitrella brassicaformis CCMP3155]
MIPADVLGRVFASFLSVDDALRARAVGKTYSARLIDEAFLMRRIASSLAQQQLTGLIELLDGEFLEGQVRQVSIENVTRPIGEVVLQQEADIVRSLTKDNFLPVMVALDYLHFDTDKIFTNGSTQSLLWRIHRWVVVEGWLSDHNLAVKVLDSFGRYAFIARFIHQHVGIRAALRPSLLKMPEVIREQWRRCERGETHDDGIMAAVSLVANLGDAISCGLVDVSRQELARFFSNATAHRRCRRPTDIFTFSSTSTARPFSGNDTGDFWCTDLCVCVAGLPHPYTPHTPDHPGCPLPPSNAISDGDAKVRDVAGWCMVLPDQGGLKGVTESSVKCFTVEASLAIPCSGGKADEESAVRLHEGSIAVAKGIPMGDGGSTSASVAGFHVVLLSGALGGHICKPSISAAALEEAGACLKEVKMKTTICTFPMRALALHYLRMCVAEGCYEEISMMARSIRREVAVHMAAALSAVKRHHLALVLHWVAAIGHVCGPACDAIKFYLKDSILENIRDVPIVLPLLPSLTPAIQNAVKEALLDALFYNDSEGVLLKELVDALIDHTSKDVAERQREVDALRLKIDTLTVADQDRRGTERQPAEMDGEEEGQGEADQGIKA